MEQVEDVLPTLLGPDDRFRTVRATIRHNRPFGRGVSA
jgi:hypothetical protein